MLSRHKLPPLLVHHLQQHCKYLFFDWISFVYVLQSCNTRPNQMRRFSLSMLLQSTQHRPVTIKCVRSTGRVPNSIVQFVLPLGATINMDGSAIHFLIACIWMAVLNGEEVTAASYILLIIITTIGSAGAAPAPSSGLVLILTAYNTTFSTVGVPNGFQYIVAIDWLLDRFDTMLNVTGDSMVAGMVAHMCPMEDIDHDKDYLEGKSGVVKMKSKANLMMEDSEEMKEQAPQN